MRKSIRWIVIVLGIAVLFGVKAIFLSKKEEAPAAGKSKGQAPVAVNYYVAKTAVLNNSVFATGVIGAFKQVDLIPEVNGKVIQINFTEGETVTKGTLLVKLNDLDLQAQHAKIKTQIKTAEQKLQRLQKLLEINGVSKEEFELQQNDLSALKSDEAFVEAQLAKTNITAPFTGVAGLRNISEGSFVSASTPIVSLVQLKPLYVEFAIPEKYAGEYKKGLKVDFVSESEDSSLTLKATVYAVEPRVDAGTRTIRARAVYDGPAALYPGSYVKVLVNLGEIKNAVMVPAQCIVPTLKGQKIYLSRGDSAVDRTVTIGIRSDRAVQVTDGLNAGDTVVASGLLAVKKGSKLKLLKAIN